MKFNFQKISSVVASVAMIGATVGIAGATAYPNPFTSGGVNGVAIVTGNDASASDFVVATDIGNSLNTVLAVNTLIGTTPVGGDSVILEKSSNKFNLGKTIGDVITTSITDDNPNDGLPNLLRDGTYTDDNNDDFDYTQEIDLENIQYRMFEDNDYKEDEPTLGFKIDNNQPILNYVLEFTDEPMWDDLPTTDLPLMGNDYYILDVIENERLVLLDSAVTSNLFEGESLVVNVGTESYDVSINFIGDNKVKLSINGDITNSLSESDTQRIDGGAYVGIKEINVQDYSGGIKNVEFSIGLGKLELNDGQNIELNGDDIAELKTSFTSSDGRLSKVEIAWTAEDDLFVTEDSEVVMPRFEAIKLSYTGMTNDINEKISVMPSNDRSIALENFPLKDSIEDIDILYSNEAGTGYIGIGKDLNNQLATTNGSLLVFNNDVHDYFVASWNDGDDAESYLMRATNFKVESGVNKTTLQYKKEGNWVDAKTDAKNGDAISIGNLELEIASEVDKSNKQVEIKAGNNVDFRTLYSKQGAKIFLPYNNTAGNENIGNLSSGYDEYFLNDSAPSTWELGFVEEDDDENIGSGDVIKFQLGFNSASTPETSVTGISYSGDSGSSTEILDTDVFRNFAYSPLATEVLWNKPSGGQNFVELVYHGEEVYGNFYLSSKETVFSSTNSTSNSGVILMIKDTQIESVSDRNIIVVGGTCINSVARDLLGVSTPLCGSDFTSATGIGENEFLIQTFSRSGGKIATLIAGYHGQDTSNAANALTTKSPEISIGTKYEGDSSGKLELVI